MADARSAGTGKITAAAAAAVLVLALGAVLWPRAAGRDGTVPLLVFDASGRSDRQVRVYEPLAATLAAAIDHPVEVTMLTRAGDLAAAAAARPAFVLAPDGLALGLDRAHYLPLAVGRGEVPRNLRPRGVLVWRRAAGEAEAPWRDRPARTVLGDSLSLTAMGVYAFAGAGDPAARPRCGPDPYDHAPVLHAARLGGFDYAVVRQWDADRFFASGLLDEAAWGVRPVTPPVPDVVIMASRDLPRRQRMAAGDALAALGRSAEAPSGPAAELLAGLDRLQLAGFNLLLEPDLDLVRGQLAPGWLPHGE